MARTGQFARIITTIVLILPIVAAAGLITLHARGERLLSVQSPSMVPAFRPGDAIAVRPAQLQELHPGDIVSYQSLQNPRMIISHRLVSIDARRGRLTTMGDAVQRPDQPVQPWQLIGKVTAVLSGFGKVLHTIHHPLGLAITIYLPAAFLIGSEIIRLRRNYRRPTYLLDYSYGAKS